MKSQHPALAAPVAAFVLPHGGSTTSLCLLQSQAQRQARQNGTTRRGRPLQKKTEFLPGLLKAVAWRAQGAGPPPGLPRAGGPAPAFGEPPTPVGLRSAEPGKTIASEEERNDTETNSTRKIGKNASDLAPRRRWASRSTATFEAGMKWQAVVVMVIVSFVLLSLALELFAPYVIMMGAYLFAWNIGIIDTKVAISNFANPALITLASLFIVVKGVDQSKLIDFLARRCLGRRSSQQMALCRFCIIVTIAGGFVNGTPLVALLMPILRDWARSRDWAPSKFLIPMSHAAMMGSQLTIIGSSTNLMVDGLLKEASNESFSFFEVAQVGLLCIVASEAYLLTVGWHFLPENSGGLFRTLKETSNMITELQVPEDFPLAGMAIREALEEVGVSKRALVKVFRRPARRLGESDRARSESDRARSESDRAHSEGQTPQNDSRSRSREAIDTTPVSSRASRVGPPSSPSKADRQVRFAEAEGFSPVASLAGMASLASPRDQHTLYLERAGPYWGLMPRDRRAFEGAGMVRQNTESELGWSLADPGVREIFPVSDQEVLEGGDVLLLSLPQEGGSTALHLL